MKKQYIACLALTLACLPTLAQTLEEEIVIERNIVPIERNAVRPSWVTPTLINPRVKSETLSFREYYNAAEITRSVSPLEPIAWADSVMRTPYRGYASAGYFPAYNLNLAAGYRFVKKPNLNAGAHVEFNGSNWSGKEGFEGKTGTNRLGIGADISALFTPGLFTADLSYNWSSSAMSHLPFGYDRGVQSLNAIDLRARWNPNPGENFRWNLGLDLGYGGFTSDKTENLSEVNSLYFASVMPANKDFTALIRSDLSYRPGDYFNIGLGVGLNFRHTNHLDDMGGTTMGIIGLTPRVGFTSKQITGSIGVQVDINTGGVRKNVHFAPDINLNWRPDSKFAAYIKAKGREVMNTNTSLWERNPWMTGVRAFERSHVNADIELGLTFGSYKGFWANLTGGWASVSDWLVPAVIDGVNTWSAESFNGLNFGLEMGYAWRDKISLEGHIMGAQHRKYYGWQDNAKWAFDIVAKVRPIAKLQIELGYEGRLSRQALMLTQLEDGTLEHSHVSIGASSNLFLGAEYQITRNLSAFIKAENLLNRHWDLTPNVQSPGIHGLLGVQYLF